MIINITPIKVLVSKAALYNEKHQGEYIEGWWHIIKCIGGKPFICEVYFPEYGASYDKLTLEDLFWKQPDIIYPNHVLQIWDCFSSDVYYTEKTLFNESTTEVFLKTKEIIKGTYMFTIDWKGYLADVFEEHKSANFIKLENGQFAAQPNNRIKFLLPSLLHDDYHTKIIDWQPRKEINSVESNPKWLLGNQTNWTYEKE